MVENIFAFFKKHYSGKKVLITGHTGFKGSWLLKTLSVLGADLKGIALRPKNENDIYNLINGDSLCESIILDIRNKWELEKEITAFEPDFVFHLAAQPLVIDSYSAPAETFEINVLGTCYLLDAVKLLKKKCQVVLVTTDKVYHNNEWIYPYRELDRLGGYDPYSSSKACAELVIDSYRNSFFNTREFSLHHKAIASARAGNVIGGGDWSENRIVPDIVKSLASDRIIRIRNPNSIRPWQHVIEPIGAYLLLGAKLDENPSLFSQAYNFGPESNDTLNVQDLVRIAINNWGSGEYKVESSGNNLHEAGVLKLDISKANSDLGWKPIYKAEVAIAETIAWYLKFREDPIAIPTFTEEQIRNYLGLMGN